MLKIEYSPPACGVIFSATNVLGKNIHFLGKLGNKKVEEIQTALNFIHPWKKYSAFLLRLYLMKYVSNLVIYEVEFSFNLFQDHTTLHNSTSDTQKELIEH